ncbi:MAG: lysophospholipid acyltransferase family protein [Acidobacteriota bacterium]
MLRLMFFALIVRPLVLIGLGLNVRRRELLPNRGPAILVANHASHLDALVLMSLYPLSSLPKLRPVAAADYFLRNRLVAWFSLNVIGIIPLSRRPKVSEGDPLAEVGEFLSQGGMAVLFPEGTRSLTGEMGELKTGVAHLARRHPAVPVVPIYVRGLNMALPKGEALFVPFFCDLFVGQPVTWTGDKESFMTELGERLHALEDEGRRD